MRTEAPLILALCTLIASSASADTGDAVDPEPTVEQAKTPENEPGAEPAEIDGASASQRAQVADTGPGHFSVGLGGEVDLVGLAYGIRPEFLFRPIADSGANLRLAVGLLAGPELTFVPVSLGYRHVWSRKRNVRPHLGAGVEYQTFWYGGESSVSRTAFYAETGFEIRVGELWLGLQLAPDLSVISRFGFGFATRVTAQYDF